MRILYWKKVGEVDDVQVLFQAVELQKEVKDTFSPEEQDNMILFTPHLAVMRGQTLIGMAQYPPVAMINFSSFYKHPLLDWVVSDAVEQVRSAEDVIV